jgi:flagellar hook-associated protein 1 FlgK
MSNVSFNLGIEALLAAQTSLDTIGHNLANANTPGYSRQNVLLTTAPAVKIGNRWVGNGVRAEAVVSVRDLLVDKRILVQRSAIARLSTASNGLGDLESLFGALGDGSLSSSLSGFFSGISSLSANPGDATLRSDAVRTAVDLTDQFHGLYSGMLKLRNDAAAQVSDQVNQVNKLTGEIVSLNHAIGAQEVDGSQANDLRDSRDEVLRNLSDLLDVTVVERPNGTIDVSSQGQILVAGTLQFQVTAKTSPSLGAELSVKGSDQKLDPKGGSIAGLLAQVRDVLPQRMQALDTLANQLIQKVNKAHSTGVPLAGPFHQLDAAYKLHDNDGDGAFDDELISQAGLPFPIQDGALTVNVTNSTTGDVNTVRIPINANQTTVGDVVQALNAVTGLDAEISDDGRLSIRAAHGYGFDFSARSFPTSGALGSSSVSISGKYDGGANADLVFKPQVAGTIGSTPNLLVDVFDSSGSKVATVDVGAGYVPGSALDLGNGLKASFGLGSIATTDSFDLHAVADGDTSNVLAAFGLNSLFTGTSASDIAVSASIQNDPSLLAAGSTNAGGDGDALAGILAVASQSLGSLGDATPQQFVGALATDIGADRSAADNELGTEQALHDGLVAQRDANSGVNSDEEMVNMLRFQQAYRASAQYLQVVNSLDDALLAILQ